MPHLEVGLLFESKLRDWSWVIDPFVMADWVNHWQDAILEKGSSGLNLMLPNTYVSLVRSEGGLRFTETYSCSLGELFLEEKVSYVNKLPCHVRSVSALFVQSVSPFSMDLFSSQMEHLVAVQAGIRFVPCHPKAPYATISYQGEFGSGVHMNALHLELGTVF